MSKVLWSRLLPATFAATLILVNLGSAADPSAAGGPPSAVRRSAVEQVVREFFSAYVAKDIDRMLALWSEQSPDLAERRRISEGLFKGSGPLEMKDLRFLAFRFDADRAFVHVLLEIVGNDLEGRPHPSLGELDRGFQLVRDGERYRIFRYGPSGLHDPGFLNQLGDAASSAELKRLLQEAYPNNLLHQYVMIDAAFMFHATPEQRARLLLHDPLDRLRKVSNVTRLNFASWTRLTEYVQGDRAALEQAEQFNQRATDVARFLDDPTSLAWCKLQNALIVQVRNSDESGSAQARTEAKSAYETFVRFEVIEGQAAAQVVIGRLSAAAGHKEAALAAFALADKLFRGVAVFGENARRTLGEYMAVRRGDCDRLRALCDASRYRGDYAEARSLERQAIAVEEEIYGPWHESLMNDYGFLGALCLLDGDFDGAREADRRGLQIAQRLYSPEHVNVVSYRDDVEEIGALIAGPEEPRREMVAGQVASIAALRLQSEGKYAEALSAWDEAIRHRSAAVGASHPYPASAWMSRARTCLRLGDSPTAAANFQRVVDIFEQTEKTQFLNYREALFEVSVLKTNRAFESLLDDDIRPAVEARQRVIEVYTREEGVDCETVVVAKDILDGLLRIQKLSAAERARFGEARRVLGVAIYQQKYTPQEKLGLYAEWLPALAETVGKDSPIFVDVLINLALVHRDLGQWPQALEVMLRIKAILDKKPAVSPKMMGQLNGLLAYIYLELGQMRQASDHARRAVEILSDGASASARNLTGFVVLNGRLDSALGNYAAAERTLLRALLLIKRQFLPQEHPDYYSPNIPLNLTAELMRGKPGSVAYVAQLNQLGLCQFRAGFNKLARTHYEAALRLSEFVEPAERERLQQTLLHNLGVVCSELRDYAAAEGYLRPVYELRQNGPRRPAAMTAASLGITLACQRKFTEALKFMNRSVELTTAEDGGLLEQDQDLLYIRGMCYAALGNRTEARASFVRTLQTLEVKFEDIASFSAVDGIQPRTLLNSAWRGLAALAMSEGATDADVTLAWDWLLRIQGRSLETLIRYRRGQRLQRGDPEVVQLIARVGEMRRAISQLALEPPADLSQMAVKARIERLSTELSQLEGDLNRRVATGSDATADASLAAVRKQVPPDAALVAYARWRPLDFQNPETYTGGIDPPRYLAFVLSAGPKAVPQVLDLGLASAIDESIADVRDSIVGTSQLLQLNSEADLEIELKKLSRSLYDRSFSAVDKAIGSSATVYLFPDGELQRIAFETLVDNRERYLIESRRFVYLTSAGDLLRERPAVSEGTVVFAGPDYNLGSQEQAEIVAALDPADGGRAKLEVTTAAPPAVAVRGERGLRWSALPHAADELRVVRDALEQSEFSPVRSFSGTQALEERLKSLRPPRILHLATHGFFVEDAVAVEDPTARGGAALGLGRLRQQQNPFLRSGLVLAGANRLGRTAAAAAAAPSTPVEDGWVTAEEIASLDLSGTELVVLSACETGLGDVRLGEGVEGLRQAFLYAGARSLVTSLYKVPDDATNELMKHFYAGLKTKRNVLDALRDAQLTALRNRREKNGAAHPYFWGSFILVGDPAGLSMTAGK